MNIKKILLELYRKLNKEFYNGTLPPINIRFSFAEQLVQWTVRYTPQYFMFINWKVLLECNEMDLYVNMMHQMVHIYNRINDIKDTSQSNHYHNKNFRKEAERIGLVMGHDSTGWCTIGLEEEVFQRVQKLFDYETFRKEIETDESKVDNRLLTHKCPKCNRMAKTLASNNLICGFCYCEYICVE